MAVNIHISGDTAGEALKELAALAAPLAGGASFAAAAEVVATAAPVVDAPKEDPKPETPAPAAETEKPKRSRSKPQEQKPDPAPSSDEESGDPDPGEPEGSNDPEPEEDAGEKVTMEQVREKLATISRAGKSAEVKALIAKFGADKLSELKEEHFGKLLKEAEKINA